MGKTPIMLVPVSLTPQMTNRFISRFGQQVAILHSGLSEGEKYDSGEKVGQGMPKWLLGHVRLFCTIDKLRRYHH